MTLGCMVHNIVEPFIKHCIDIIFLSKNMKPVTFTWPYNAQAHKASHIVVLTYSDYTARFGKEKSAPIIPRENFHYFKLPCIYLQRLYMYLSETRHGLVNLILPRTLTQMTAIQEQKVSHTSQ